MKILQLRNGKQFKVCDSSTTRCIVNVFNNRDELAEFRKELTDDALSRATLDKEKFKGTLVHIYQQVDMHNGNITAGFSIELQRDEDMA